jgi:hypothetical protein
MIRPMTISTVMVIIKEKKINCLTSQQGVFFALHHYHPSSFFFSSSLRRSVVRSRPGRSHIGMFVYLKDDGSYGGLRGRREGGPGSFCAKTNFPCHGVTQLLRPFSIQLARSLPGQATGLIVSRNQFASDSSARILFGPFFLSPSLCFLSMLGRSSRHHYISIFVPASVHGYRYSLPSHCDICQAMKWRKNDQGNRAMTTVPLFRPPGNQDRGEAPGKG